MKKLLGITLIIFMGLSGIAFSQTGVDLSSDKVPKGFKGDDIIGVVKALSKSVYTKGLQKRIDLSDKKDVDRVYVFKLSDDKVFSSPAGVWIEKSTEGIAPRYIGPKEVYYLIKDMGKKRKNWTGQSVFGARVMAETTTELQYFVTPINGTDNIKKLAVKPEGGKVGVLFIGKPAEHINKEAGAYTPEGYISYCGQSYSATFDMPYDTSRKFYSLRMDLQEVWVYDQDTGNVLLKQKVEKQNLDGQKRYYINKLGEIHTKMKQEFGILAKAGPNNAVAVSVVVISNVKKLIDERDNLKYEALKYFHRQLPPDLAKKFEESERFTDLARKTMQNAGAQW